MSERQATTGERLDFLGHEVELAEPCDDGDNGNHACATHGMIFPSNAVAAAHVDKRGTQHVTFWFCHAHGPEATR